MNDKELGKALLKHDTGSAADSAVAFRSALDRDRRRLRLLTALTVVLGFIACALMIWTIVVFLTWVLPRMEMVSQETLAGTFPKGTERPREEAAREVVGTLTQVVLFLGKTITIAVVGFGLSLVFTVLLIFTSRRATLRHIDASLLEISEQLKRLGVPQEKTVD